MKRIVLCADDYGQSLAISQAILALIAAKRLTAVSCLVNMPESKSHGHWLKSYQNQIDIGLHLNLSEGKALSAAFRNAAGAVFPALSTLIQKVCLSQVNPDLIRAECHAQIDAFYDIYGFMPMFLDGHQHVHQFPLIRDVVVDVFKNRLPKDAYMRSVNPRLCFTNLNVLCKQIVIRALGASRFQRKLIESNIAHNATFSGIYHFSGNYKVWFQYFLNTITNRGLIMCHPSQKSAIEMDSHAKARYQEYDYLSSETFLHDCSKAGVEFRRFGTL